MEVGSHANGFLAGHGIGHQQRLNGLLNPALDALDPPIIISSMFRRPAVSKITVVAPLAAGLSTPLA